MGNKSNYYIIVMKCNEQQNTNILIKLINIK